MDLNHLRTVQARGQYANYTITMVAVGIHIFMALYGLCVFLETPQHLRKGRKKYITTSLLVTCLFTLTASLDMAGYFQLNIFNWKTKLSHTSLYIAVWMGDVLLAYRCYVMCVDHRWVAAFPGATSVCALVLGLITMYRYNSKYDTANILLTVSTNVTVTTLIMFHILRSRRTLSKIIPLEDLPLYTGVVAILIESALPPSILGIITAALLMAWNALIVPPSEGFVICYYLFSGLFYIFCTLSPQMIIFRITAGRSFMKFPTLKDDLPLTTDRWAYHTGGSSFLQSSFNNRQIGRGTETDIERLGGSSSNAIRISVITQASGDIQIVEEKREKAGAKGEVER